MGWGGPILLSQVFLLLACAVAASDLSVFRFPIFSVVRCRRPFLVCFTCVVLALPRAPFCIKSVSEAKTYFVGFVMCVRVCVCVFACLRLCMKHRKT